MSLHRFLGLASIALVVGCARTDAIQPVALPFAFAPTDEPPPPEAPLRTLEGLAAAPANAAIAPDLLRLMATETDARCRAYLDAGARAWLAGCRDAAVALWGLALECGPTRSVCLPVGDTHALFAHRPLDLGSMPALGETGPPPARRAFSDFPALGLGATSAHAPEADLVGLVRALVPRAEDAEGRVVVRGAHALELLPRGALAARATQIDAFARLQREVAIAIEVRWIRFPLGAADATAALFEAREGCELDRSELERLRIAHDGEVVCAPRITVFPGQLAHIAIVKQLAYVQDVELTASPSGEVVADPVLGTAVAGQTVEVCAAVVGPDAVAMRIAPATCEVGEPMPEVRIVNPGLVSPITIQLPRSTAYAVSRVVTVPRGRTRWLPVGLSIDAAGVRHRIGVAIEAAITPLAPSALRSAEGR